MQEYPNQEIPPVPQEGGKESDNEPDKEPEDKRSYEYYEWCKRKQKKAWADQKNNQGVNTAMSGPDSEGAEFKRSHKDFEEMWQEHNQAWDEWRSEQSAKEKKGREHKPGELESAQKSGKNRRETSGETEKKGDDDKDFNGAEPVRRMVNGGPERIKVEYNKKEGTVRIINPENHKIEYCDKKADNIVKAHVVASDYIFNNHPEWQLP